MSDEIHEFSSGASSSGNKPRYDLIPQLVIERLAQRFELGYKKYGPYNWHKGLDDTDFLVDRLNHALEHIMRAQERIKGETRPEDRDKPHDDDLAAACVSIAFAMCAEQREKLAMPQLPASTCSCGHPSHSPYPCKHVTVSRDGLQACSCLQNAI